LEQRKREIRRFSGTCLRQGVQVFEGMDEQLHGLLLDGRWRYKAHVF
jgi:hypothetical protein